MNAQCGFGWNDSGVVVTPTAGAQLTPNIQAGEYFLINVVNGGTYTISTCNLGTWDTQLSLYNQTTSAFVAYNDDACANFRSETSFTATFTGQVRVILNQYNCAASANTSQVQYSGIIPGPQLTVGNVSVDEDAGTLAFTVDHTGLASSGPYTVTYNTVDGTAGPTDYTPVTGGTLNFDGTLGDSETITISITDDSLYETSEDFTLEFATTTDASVDITDTAIGTIDDDEVILNNTDLVLVEELDGYIGYTSTGGSLRTQDNNTNACSITTTSNNTLTSAVPVGATIDKAFLYWAHSNATPDSQVTFEGNTVDADLMYTTTLTGGRIFYGGVSDVTSIVAGIANPNSNSFDFSGLTIDNSPTYCSSATVLGGWSLIVFYTDLNLPASTVNVYQGFHGESNTTSTYTLDGFFAIGASGSKTTVLSWEGDQTLNNNEALEFTTGAGTNDLVGDGDNTIGSPNPFNSTIYDNTGGTTVNITTSYGVDLDTYDVSSYISAGESTATTRVESGQDFVILNAVVLKVPSNLVTGNVFEDINYGGGAGRDLISSSGIPIEGVDMELYDNTNSRIQTTTTDTSGEYVFGGMANGTYTIRAVNSTVRSTRTGGAACTSCMPVQTFKTDYVASALIPDINAVGGENPSGVDPSANTLTGAQSISSMTISSEGVVGMDFGYNFNTIVNTNDDEQGSLEQFIINSNALDASGLDIVANSIFDPLAGDDTSIFMIPPTGDIQGRTADANYASGYFDIDTSSNQLTVISGASTKIDGRTQTAYSGDTNTGNVGSGGTTVGTSANTLPDYERPEIQVHRDGGDVFRTQGDLFEMRNISVYGGNNASVRIQGGSATLVGNLLGVNATGVASGNVDYGVEITNGASRIEGNYIAQNTDEGIYVNGGTSTLIQENHITDNGRRGPCYENIRINNGTGVVIRRNLIDRAASLGIDGDGITGNVAISENTITNSGQDTGTCSGNNENAGILLDGNNSSISNNIIASNGGPGIVLAGGNTSGNLISQNSIYANGTAADALGIDLDLSDDAGDGVTLNDTGDVDNGPNSAINFPIIETAYKSGSNVVVSGWSRPGATIEFFLTDINQGTATLGDNQLGLSADYGEGQVFLASVVEGGGSDTNSSTSFYLDDDSNTDNTNKFTFTFAVPPGIILGDDLTATATIANSTSEFSPFSKLKAFTVITNRRITYRVKKE
ncbi:beta strand repeat-containing protein [Maribacter sp. 2308TA10-17]|uniref:beta strand repeat-containing protein n=1 Tax=Maribacter sp. 2308TA10-17 TaxID=3386276 RepID=UPI0039BD7EC9